MTSLKGGIMSISSISTIAVARNSGAPTKADSSEATADAPDAEEAATLPALLVKTVPTSLVAGYTAFIALVTTTLVTPTATNPHPDQYLPIRWVAVIMLVAASAAGTYFSYRRKAGTGARFPMLEVAAVAAAAAGWALASPGSPLFAGIDDSARRTITLGVAGFAGIALTTVLANLMKTPAGQATSQGTNDGTQIEQSVTEQAAVHTDPSTGCSQ
jgi:hypothetical protein